MLVVLEVKKEVSLKPDEESKMASKKTSKKATKLKKKAASGKVRFKKRGGGSRSSGTSGTGPRLIK